jgi:predicted nuclease of predicted toxin-antitoxin system
VRFVIDENVPLVVATALKSLGHECSIIAEVDPRARDETVMDLARREQAVLVTFDSDFGRMIFHELKPSPPGVVYMRGRPGHARLVSDIFLDLFKGGTLNPVGRYVVIELGQDIRIIPLGKIND